MNEASGGRFSGVQYYIFLKRADILEGKWCWQQQQGGGGVAEAVWWGFIHSNQISRAGDVRIRKLQPSFQLAPKIFKWNQWIPVQIVECIAALKEGFNKKEKVLNVGGWGLQKIELLVKFIFRVLNLWGGSVVEFTTLGFFPIIITFKQAFPEPNFVLLLQCFRRNI